LIFSPYDLQAIDYQNPDLYQTVRVFCICVCHREGGGSIRRGEKLDWDTLAAKMPRAQLLQSPPPAMARENISIPAHRPTMSKMAVL
jgi:hypothetical protein